MELTKKDSEFNWTKECKDLLNALIEIVTVEPVLKCPDLEKAFELEVDASAFVIRAVLIQWDETGRCCKVGYYSKALNATEWNYNIWDREFMSVIFGLRN